MGRQELHLYKQMPKWTKDTVPEAFLSKHNTAEGTWGHITVTKGRLKFYELDEKGAVQEEYELSPERGAWGRGCEPRVPSPPSSPATSWAAARAWCCAT